MPWRVQVQVRWRRRRDDVKSVCANNAIFGFSVKCFIVFYYAALAS